ncbi:MAG TPA: hypothetical protein VFG91_03775 [Woeseiaceae bacterium]|nr:hypothetical protein [Woeseiaceae bacterium]
MSSDDDCADIEEGVAFLRKAMKSIHTARRSVENMRESNDKRDAMIDLAHAGETAAFAERLFSLLIGKAPYQLPVLDADAEDDLEQANEIS